MPRVDMNPLAKSLSQQEGGSGQWTFDGVDSITPSLKLTGKKESSISPGEFRSQLESFLKEAQPAWDPFDSPVLELQKL